jgi:hypothetical protein|tara:strand:- start:2433 stop:2900 length:468 start_codon:yes stop_codon:yes gene_type:complete
MTDKVTKTSEGSTSRTHQKRKVTYTPPSYLDAPQPNVAGVKYRWLRVSTGGEDDARNISKRRREGYEFVRKDEHPDFDVPVHESGKYAGVIGSGDLVLAKIDEEMLDAKREYYEGKTRQQTQAVDADILKEQHPSMPLTQNRKSSVSLGKKKDSD